MHRVSTIQGRGGGGAWARPGEAHGVLVLELIMPRRPLTPMLEKGDVNIICQHFVLCKHTPWWWWWVRGGVDFKLNPSSGVPVRLGRLAQEGVGAENAPLPDV